ncbi:hypothetical protein [Paenibacillus mucilaginosus]|uniref:Uncharacterized protein n=2 Tax=Paenibacillus mucilaginosus TaxID=61624 RepID=H6NTH3_9BACL|nr:hypothetical protein [Paenibacillus mucilaginosus]AEI38794.1 hypothetical protein KNP414_00143 [Paenibacillus mucilaginosus KNP414]AFC27120.1 hypothetical protein PM3016_138 [Paenibacillus mucilaginosus 3016]MCG7215928.1 hypothetical protein [Paenibacillus mucilaginosus]WDM27873.1 hypothetical protein KCX80_00705 [Paenibacillus mucilaginosus]
MYPVSSAPCFVLSNDRTAAQTSLRTRSYRLPRLSRLMTQLRRQLRRQRPLSRSLA